MVARVEAVEAEPTAALLPMARVPSLSSILPWAPPLAVVGVLLLLFAWRNVRSSRAEHPFDESVDDLEADPADEPDSDEEYQYARAKKPRGKSSGAKGASKTEKMRKPKKRDRAADRGRSRVAYSSVAG